MNNQYLSQELYNEDFKNRFLEKQKLSTSRYYKYIFKKSYEIESTVGKCGKDIYEFNIEEIDTLLMSYPNGSIGAIESVASVLRDYIDFAIAEGYVSTKINYMDTISGHSSYEKYLNVNKIRNKIITERELREICYSCENAQDAVCFALPFYGVKGEANEEMLNLKESDINFTQEILRLSANDESTRHLKVDDFLVNLLHEAINETGYAKENGGSEYSGVYMLNTDSEYVLKTGGKKVNEPAHQLLPNTRIKRVGRLLGNNKLSPMSLWYSGMYNMYLKIKESKGEISESDYVGISKAFNYNVTSIKKKIKELDSVIES